jgi:hypothetical protein
MGYRVILEILGYPDLLLFLDYYLDCKIEDYESRVQRLSSNEISSQNLTTKFLIYYEKKSKW